MYLATDFHEHAVLPTEGQIMQAAWISESYIELDSRFHIVGINIVGNLVGILQLDFGSNWANPWLVDR
jgi:hypothetical protein